MQLLRVLGIILEETKPSEIPLKIIRSTVDVLKADVGVLLTIKDANYADISLAYDRAMQRAIPAMLSLNLEAQPTLVNCIERRQQRPLFADRNTDELRDLYDRLDIGQIGPAYFQPLMRGDEIIGLMVIGLPYAKRELRDSEREQLKGIGIIAGSLLALSYEADHARQRAEERAIQAMISGIPIDEIDDADVVAARKEMEAALDEARIHNNELQRHIALLKIELDDERSRLMRLLGDTEADMSISQRIIAINDDQERLRAERDELAQQLEEAETALASATGTDTEAMVQTLTETLRREKDSLEAERDALVAQLAEIRGEGVPSEEVNLNEVMAQMTAEKMRLEADTEVMQGRLQDIEGQLEALGIEGGAAGLAQLVRQLYDQRAALQARSDGLQIERDALWNERKRFEARIKREAEREANIEEMQTEIQHLASDREAITRQRDQYRAERDELAVKNDAVRRHRARLLAEASAFEQELEEVREETQYLRVEMQRLLDERSQWIQERDRLIANNSRLMAEIGQDSVSPEDLMSALDSTGSMQRSITELAGERSRLEAELNRTRMLLNTTEQELFELRNNARETGRSSAEADAEAILGLVQELRSPLTSVMGYVDLLETESISGFLGEQQRRYLARVGANVVRLQSMVEELVHLTALETGRFALDTKPVDLVEVVEEVIDATSPQFREKGLTLHLNLDDDVPPVNADPEAMSQVINALLMNAYLVTPADSDVFVQAGKRAVTLNGSGPVDCLLVSVEDRGGGIADVDKALVFARRYKVEHSLIAGLGDTGVGLSIAKAIVEAHGGAIWVDSVEGVGTMMRFALPYASEETPA